MKRKPTEKKKQRSVVEVRGVKVVMSPKPTTVRIWDGQWKEVPICH